MLYSTPLLDTISSQLRNDGPYILQSTGKEVSRKEFREALDSFSYFISNFLSLGETFAVWIRDEVIFSEILIAGLRSGGVTVLLDPEVGSALIHDQIRETGVKYIFIEGRIYDVFFITRNTLLQLPVEYIILGKSIFGSQCRKISRQSLKVEPTNPESIPASTACIIVFTGGTTQAPKAVLHSHNSLYLSAQKIGLLLGGVKRMYVDMPHFLLFGILLGIPLVTGRNTFSSQKIFSLIEKYQVDGYFSPPYRYEYALEKGSIPSCLKLILLGSAPVYHGFLARFIPLLDTSQKIICVYGMTEILPIAIIDGREKVQLSGAGGDILGRVCDGIDAKCIEDEFLVRGEHQSYSYFGKDSHEYISTGDLGYFSEGMLIMTGRKKDMIIRKDYNIYPSLYESILSEIPGVVEVALIGVYEEKNLDEKIILFLEVAQIQYSKGEIQSMLKKGRYEIDAFALPDEIIFMKIPRKGRQQKVDKDALRLYAKNISLGR